MPAANLTSVSESVTALLTFLMMVSGGSRIEMNALGFSSDLDIFFAGAARLITLPPFLGMWGSGTVNVLPYRPLKRWAMFRENSRTIIHMKPLIMPPRQVSTVKPLSAPQICKAEGSSR